MFPPPALRDAQIAFEGFVKTSVDLVRIGKELEGWEELIRDAKERLGVEEGKNSSVKSEGGGEKPIVGSGAGKGKKKKGVKS